ncbi:aminodeoxychorismate synthase component I [Novosphingobium terrae]|uniref:aminodeoxychorismate synthase component I n=1 Tax=Novosphingobium terrae TaxID=2726189 RepID=UPI001981DE01|nr:aminodeoxychorismate synthase component I [Novosphingobium terrae]
MPAIQPFDRTTPFILLDDARQQGAGPARLYTSPYEVVIARRADEVEPALARLETLRQQGAALAGYAAYEAGLALEPRLAAQTHRRGGGEGLLLWFGAFAGWQEISAADVPAWLAAQARGERSTIGPLKPGVSPGAYAQGFARLKQAIADGDIYQANYTFPLSGPWQGDPLALYALLRGRGGGAYGALIFDGDAWLLSHSPELFFTCDNGLLTARPMKGTRPRGQTPDQDRALRAQLQASTKDRAENLMILDLMRNDLSRIAVPGSVKVPEPFAIESYPSVHQMVSAIEAQLLPDHSPIDVLRALFPCGSVTGAPKIRAMELIEAVEPSPRGVYCGAIGHIDPPENKEHTGRAAFNVAIRTLRLTGEDSAPSAKARHGRAVLGVGSAVVADSALWPEWRECLVKGGFVHQPVHAETGHAAQIDLIETMRFTPEEGMALLEFHLERLKISAAALGFSFDRHAARNAIHALGFELETPSRIRLTLSRSGATTVEAAPLPAPLDAQAPVSCILLPLPVDPSDWRLAHKTSDRWFYEAGLKAARKVGAHEAIFVREDNLITEGCFTNVFVERDGVLLTPPTAHGLLGGVLRRSLIEEGKAREADLTPDDLAEGFLIGNGLRGLMRAQLLD